MGGASDADASVIGTHTIPQERRTDEDPRTGTSTTIKGSAAKITLLVLTPCPFLVSL